MIRVLPEATKLLPDDLDPFTAGYLRAMDISTCAHHPHLREAAFSPQLIGQAKDDCRVWKAMNADNLFRSRTIDVRYDSDQAGADFWLARNGRPSFSHQGLGAVGDDLEQTARAAGPVLLFATAAKLVFAAPTFAPGQEPVLNCTLATDETFPVKLIAMGFGFLADDDVPVPAVYVEMETGERRMLNMSAFAGG